MVEKKLCSFGDFSAFDTGCANSLPLRAALWKLDADGLQIRIEAAARAVVSV